MDWSPSQSTALPGPSQRSFLIDRYQQSLPRHRSPIRLSEGPLQQAMVQRAEEEAGVEAETETETEVNDSEADGNKAFIRETLFDSEDSSSDSSNSNSSSNAEAWENEEAHTMHGKKSWIGSGKSNRSKERLVRILRGMEPIPKNRWSFRKILATLMYHRKDKRLRRAFGQLRFFHCHTMMTETKKGGQWPGALRRKDINTAIKLRFQLEIEKRYAWEVQALCKAKDSAFGMLQTTTASLEDVDRAPLENIVNQAAVTAPLLSSLVESVGPSTKSTTAMQLVSMKLVAMLVILCRSAHRNNSNYLPLLIALYMYSAGARVDAITLLNHLGLSVSYSVLLKRLRGVSTSSKAWIKARACNPALVGAWDNFEYRENVHGERIGDKVKFRSITMALWILKGWKIPPLGLKQSMWNSQQGLPIKAKEVLKNIFERDGKNIREQCVRSHRFNAFLAAFPEESWSFFSPMPKINLLDCTLKTEAYAFAPSVHSESSLAGSIGVFNDLNVGQMGIEQSDPQWNERLTLWWGDLKTWILMHSMQARGKNGPYA